MRANPALHLYVAAALRRTPRRKRLPKVPAQTYPRMVERAYARDLVEMLRPARSLIEQHVVPMMPALLRAAGFRGDAERADDDDDYSGTIERVFDWIRLEYERHVTPETVKATARGVGAQVEKHNKAQVTKQIKAVLNIDVLNSEAWLRPVMGAFTTQNVSLIKSIPSRYFSEIQALVMRSVGAGRRPEDIASEIRERFKVSESRAVLIARDQVGKFNGQLTRARQEDLGLGRYRWRTAMDERVRGNPDGKYPNSRPSHFAREGKPYSWDKPPKGGHPGEAINCRCWAEPVFEDILGSDSGMDLTRAPVSNEVEY